MLLQTSRIMFPSVSENKDKVTLLGWFLEDARLGGNIVTKKVES